MSFMSAICYAQNLPVLPAKPKIGEKGIDIPYNIKMKYADLSPEEQRLIAAYIKTPVSDPRFKALKLKIMRNIGNLYAEYMKLPVDAKERISITAKLVDYSKIIRGSGITLPELRWAAKNQSIGRMTRSTAIRPIGLNDIKKGTMTITPEELPYEIKNILENLELKEGCSYMKYLKENTNFILFVPKLDATVTIMTNNDIGTIEELTRTAIIDTYNEDTFGYAKTWFLAATILTEASHIEWYYRHNGDASMLGYDINEANSINFTNGFLQKLLDSCGTLIDKKEKDDILYVLSENSKKLRKLQEIK